MSKLPDGRRWQAFGAGVLVDARVVERCGYCDFRAAGTLEQTRQAFQTHVCGRPRHQTAARRRSGFALRSARPPDAYT